MLIAGDPGTGKSAIVAELIHRNPGGQVLAYHCCQADTPATLEPALWIRSLAAMIASRIDRYAALLSDPEIAAILEESNCSKDPASAFEKAILAPLETLPSPNEGVRYVLIDALDEAVATTESSSRQTIVDVLATRLERLPSWLRIIATTRKEASVLNRLRGLRALEISTEDPRNITDIQRYIQASLDDPVIADRLSVSKLSGDRATRLLLARCAGNFLYIQQALQGIRRGIYDFDRLHELPPGLYGLYSGFFMRHFPTESSYAPVKSLLETVLAAREHLNEEELARVTGLEPEEELPRLLGSLSSYLPEREGRYALYHKSFADWLTDPGNRGTPYYISRKKGHQRLAAAFLHEYERGPAGISELATRHLIFHLAMAGDVSQIERVMKDGNFLPAMIKESGTGSLIADLHVVAKQMEALALLCSELIRILSRRASLLDQFPLLAAQELANQSIIPAARLSDLRRLTGKPQVERQLQRCEGPLDKKATSLPPVVVDVDIASNGKLVATVGGTHHGIWIWRLPEGEPETFLLGHRAGVSKACFLPDSQQLLSGAWDRHVMLWNLENAQILADFCAHQNIVQAIAVSKDGRTGASGGWDGRIVVYDLLNRAVAFTLCEDSGFVNSLKLSPDGGRLCAANGDGVMTLWDVPLKQILSTWKGLHGLVKCIDVDWTRGFALACTLSGNLYAIALDSPEIVAVGRADDVPLERVVLMPGSRTGITGDRIGRLTAWSVPDMKPLAQREAHSGRCPAATVSGDMLITAGGDQCLRAWEVPSLQPLWTRRTASLFLINADFAGDGSLWHGVDHDGVIFRGRGHGQIDRVESPNELGPGYAIRWVKDDAFAVGTTTGHLALLKPSGFQWLQRIHRTAICRVSVSPQKDAIATLDISGNLCIVDATCGQTLFSFSAKERIAAIGWDKDGQELFWCEESGAFRSVGLNERKFVRDVPVNFAGVNEVLVVDAPYLAVICSGSQLYEANWRDGTVLPFGPRFPLGIGRIVRTDSPTEAMVLGQDGTFVIMDMLGKKAVAATQVPMTPLAVSLRLDRKLSIVDAGGFQYDYDILQVSS